VSLRAGDGVCRPAIDGGRGRGEQGRLCDCSEAEVCEKLVSLVVVDVTQNERGITFSSLDAILKQPDVAVLHRSIVADVVLCILFVEEAFVSESDETLLILTCTSHLQL